MVPFRSESGAGGSSEWQRTIHFVGDKKTVSDMHTKGVSVASVGAAWRGWFSYVWFS